MGIGPSLKHSATQRDPLLGVALRDVWTAERALEQVRDLVELATIDGEQAGFGIAQRVVDPSRREALRR